jgi:hypothetical protein
VKKNVLLIIGLFVYTNYSMAQSDTILNPIGYYKYNVNDTIFEQGYQLGTFEYTLSVSKIILTNDSIFLYGNLYTNGLYYKLYNFDLNSAYVSKDKKTIRLDREISYKIVSNSIEVHLPSNKLLYFSISKPDISPVIQVYNTRSIEKMYVKLAKRKK